MSTKALQEKIVSNMRKWRKVENATISATSSIMEKTDNPVVRLVMEIIQHDSQMHYRVQEIIADSLETKALTLNPDELAEIWDMVEEHIKMEQHSVDLALECLEGLKGKKMIVQEYLLNYLKVDEEKHNKLLEDLEKIKGGMYPYA